MSQKHVASVILAALVAISSIVLVVNQDDDGHGHKRTTIEFHVNQRAGDGAPTKQLSAPLPQVREVNRNLPDKQMRDETPPIAQQKAPGELTAAQKAVARIKATQAPLPTAGATQGFPGCRTMFVQNQSSRNGVRPQLIVYHYTVSHNVPGWADVLAVVHLFDTRSFQASAAFVIDGEGNCAYLVPIENKSWAQAAANPFSVAIEVIDYGNEPTYMASPGYLKLAQVTLEISKRTGIPIRRGKVNGCVPIVSGIVQHADFGFCGGGHHDINPFSIDAVVKVVQSIVAQAQKPPVSRAARAKCRDLNTLRRRTASYRRRHGLKPPARPLTAAERLRGHDIRVSLRRGHYRCVVGAPGKRGTIERRG